MINLYTAAYMTAFMCQNLFSPLLARRCALRICRCQVVKALLYIPLYIRARQFTWHVSTDRSFEWGDGHYIVHLRFSQSSQAYFKGKEGFYLIKTSQASSKQPGSCKVGAYPPIELKASIMSPWIDVVFMQDYDHSLISPILHRGNRREIWLARESAGLQPRQCIFMPVIEVAATMQKRALMICIISVRTWITSFTHWEL